MDKSMKSLDKCWNDSLSCLDNIYVKVVLYVVLILFASKHFENINMYFAHLHKNYKFLNIIVLLLIVYLGRKCPVIGILLAICYVISLTHMSSNEKFTSGTSGDDGSSSGGDDDEDKTMYAKPNNNEDNVESFLPNFMRKDEDNVENFFPNLMRAKEDKEENSFDYEMKKNSGDCKSLYTPEFEAVGNVCDSVNTFKDELNAQGLNSPLGFNSNVMGSPL